MFKFFPEKNFVCMALLEEVIIITTHHSESKLAVRRKTTTQHRGVPLQKERYLVPQSTNTLNDAGQSIDGMHMPLLL